MSLPVIFKRDKMKAFYKNVSMRKELEWTLKIWEISLKLEDQEMEFSKYIEEMPLIVPNAKNPEIALKKLERYYDSLKLILNEYISKSSDYHRSASKVK